MATPEQERQQAEAAEEALEARRRLAIGWPVAALVAGLLAVLIGLLVAWLA